MTSQETFVLAIDQGTSGTSASLYNRNGQSVDQVDVPVSSTFPQPGWINQDPYELLDSIRISTQRLLQKTGILPSQIDSLGIANQAEPLLLWDIKTGVPVYPAIGWQCVRSAGYCEQLKKQGYEPEFRARTGMPLHPEWPATKIQWIFEHCPEYKELLSKHQLVFSSLDTWFIYHLTREQLFVTDTTTAARSGLYNINKLDWDPFLIELFGAQDLLLPEVVGSNQFFGKADLGVGEDINWRGSALDQAAALLGQVCLQPGETKITYGTCSALWYNLGDMALQTEDLATSVAWNIDEKVVYAIDGESGTAGAALLWLRDRLGLTSDFSKLASLAEKVKIDHDLIFIPALYGLGAPHWAPNARGAIFGLSSSIGMEHFVKAALEAIAFGIRDVVESIGRIDGASIPDRFIADGGMTANAYLMQFQADILGKTIVVPKNQEGTSAGVAFLAGLGSGFYPSFEYLKRNWIPFKEYKPQMDEISREKSYQKWQKAIRYTIDFASS